MVSGGAGEVIKQLQAELIRLGRAVAKGGGTRPARLTLTSPPPQPAF